MRCLLRGRSPFPGLAPAAQAATVNYGDAEGTNDSVTGNTGITNFGFPPQNTGNASDNTVNVTGGTVNILINGGYHTATDGNGDATASNNQVNIETFTGSTGTAVDGGSATTWQVRATATAHNNTVDITGGQFGVVRGSLAQSTDGPASASGNTLRLTGVDAGFAYGAQSQINSATSTGTAVANNNQVFITDSTVRGSVAGGITGNPMSSTPTVVHNNNSVTLMGATTVGQSVFGGMRENEYLVSPYNNGSGNTLNIKSPMDGGIRVDFDVQYFQNYNFYIPATMTTGGIMLDVGGTAFINNSTVNVGVEGSSSPLAAGDTIVLINAGTLDGTPANTTANGQGMQGVTLLYDFDLLVQGNQLLAQVSSGARVNPQAKALAEGYLGGMGLALQGADLAAGAGTVAAVKAASASGNGIAGFGTLAGSSMRYNTGSHIDMSSLNMLAGLALGTDLAPGRLTLGAFFEYGNGAYSTYNSFSNAASVSGDGNMWSVGGGLLARMDFIDTGPGHFYAEASGRMGKLHNKYDNGDLRDATGRKAEYESSTPYYSLHAGAGYVWNINEKASLDLYGKYFWTRQDVDSRTLSTGEALRFDAVDSHRVRVGGRFAYTLNDYVAPYIGAAFEHEFDGTARATTNGIAIDSPSLKGSSGVGELGLTFTPSASLPLSIDLGVQGHVGQRQGVSGNVLVKWEF